MQQQDHQNYHINITPNHNIKISQNHHINITPHHHMNITQNQNLPALPLAVHYGSQHHGVADKNRDSVCHYSKLCSEDFLKETGGHRSRREECCDDGCVEELHSRERNLCKERAWLSVCVIQRLMRFRPSFERTKKCQVRAWLVCAHDPTIDVVDSFERTKPVQGELFVKESVCRHRKLSEINDGGCCPSCDECSREAGAVQLLGDLSRGQRLACEAFSACTIQSSQMAR